MLQTAENLSITFSTPIIFAGLDEDQLIANRSFDTAGGGGADVFDSWDEDDASAYASFTRDTVVYYDGSASCKITSDTAPDIGPPEVWGSVSQDITVTANKTYELSFYTKTEAGFATEQGYFSVYDNNKAEYIVTRTPTGVFSTSTWGYVTCRFYVPYGTTSIKVAFWQGGEGGKSVWYDLSSLRMRNEIVTDPLPEWTGTELATSYRHTISANLGYDNMQVSTFGNLNVVSEWLERGLARHASVRAAGGQVIWEGFVNEVSAQLGGITITIGPLTDVVNRGRIVYNTINWDTTPPVPGVTVRTQFLDSTDSQDKFGILEGIITGGEGTYEEMIQLLETLVSDVAWPEISQTVNIGQSGNLALTISCLGYGHMLDKFHYYQTQYAGTYTGIEKIQDILDTDPNLFFSKSNVYFETFDSTVEKYESEDKTALAILKEIVTAGDSAYNRFIFMVMEGRKFHLLNATEREPLYNQSIYDGTVYTNFNSPVQPYDVRAGEWLFIYDAIPGMSMATRSYKSDPRYMFIESVTYTAPYGLAITGGRASKFKQRLDRLGLGGL